MPRFEFSEGNSNKFWEIVLHGNSFTIHYGRIGTEGQQQFKTFGSEAEAKKEYDSLIGQKLKKGYVKVSDEVAGAATVGSTQALSKDEFWALIDSSRRGTEDPEEQVEKLIEMLAKLSEEQIFDFDRHYQEAHRDAFRSDIWAAAYIINGGCSDDGFDYFLGWLIAQGKRFFEATLADPQHAGTKAEPGDFVECESMLGAASSAYEQKTGKTDFYERSARVPCELQGELFDEDTVDQLYPKLAKKFNAAV